MITMAQRIAKIQLMRKRRQLTVTLQGKMSLYKIQPPNVVQLTRPRFGWNNKTFEVIETQLVMTNDNGSGPCLAST